MHSANISNNCIRTEFLGTDNASERQILYNLRMFQMCNFGNHLRNSAAISIQRNNDILLIHTCHGNQRVALLNPLAFQKTLTAGVSMHHAHIRKLGRKLDASLIISLYNLNLDTAFLKLIGQVKTNSASAADHNALYLMGNNS